MLVVEVNIFNSGDLSPECSVDYHFVSGCGWMNFSSC